MLLAVPLSLSEGQAAIVPKSDASLSTIPKGKPLFYTQLDMKLNQIIGFKIDQITLKTKKVWNIKLGADKEIVSIKTQYDSASTASQQKHYLPTDYGQSGELLYKYLDSNMFAVVSSQIEDPTELTIQIINAVTGRLVH